MSDVIGLASNWVWQLMQNVETIQNRGPIYKFLDRTVANKTFELNAGKKENFVYSSIN